jgi:transcriptional regulator with XRE-family HTH domain
MPKTKNKSVEDDSPIARGLRLRKARTMTPLSSEQMAEALGYSRQSVSYWENGANGGLSQKGAVLATRLLREHGIQCDISYLLHGIGDVTPIQPGEKALLGISIASETDLFVQIHSNAVVTQLTHPFMQPFFDKGDWVGGCFVPMHSKLVGLTCIVEIKKHYEVRQIKKGNKKGKYNLIFIHDGSDPQHPFELTNVPLQKAALIIRVWKKPLIL